MKAIIEGKKYDTETAALLADWSNGYSTMDFNFCSERLYRKKNGEYFLHGLGGANTRYASYSGDNRSAGEEIRPFTEEKARKWAERHASADKYEEIFGEVEE